MKTITVMNRATAIDASYTISKPTIIISINNVGSNSKFCEQNRNLIDVLHVFFDDEERNGKNPMTKEDAKKILNFIEKNKDIKNIIVHCSAGVSRSAGTAAALMLIMNNNDSEIFSSPKYCPNMHCYRTLLNESFLFKKEDINNLSNEKIGEQQKIWWEFRKEDF